MIAVNVDSKTTTIPLGRQGENLARVIYFDLSEMIEEYGEGTATLMNKRVGDSVAYKCTTTQSGDLLTWMPTNTDTAYSGTGKCELRWVVGNVLAKSVTYKTTITPSITAETDLPASYQTWYESLLAEISEYTIASADIAKNKSDIATCKTNIATNTAAIAALNSRTSDTVGFHNCIYRGKDITSYLTNGSLWNRIKGAGGYKLFEDLYLGDYITVGSNHFAIVDFDYYLRCGSIDMNEHHIVMMPVGAMNIPEGTALYGTSESLTFINTANAGVTVTSQESATAFKWNATMDAPNTNSTNGGYKYSRMRTVVMKAANTIVVNAFGAAHVKPITVIYPNPSDASASGIASGWAWFDQDNQSNIMCKSICDLPNETQVYGQQVWGRGSAYTNVGYEIGTDKFQFAIFAFHRNFANYRGAWWLRSVGSASYAAGVFNGGDASSYGSAYAFGARPRFLLVG